VYLAFSKKRPALFRLGKPRENLKIFCTIFEYSRVSLAGKPTDSPLVHYNICTFRFLFFDGAKRFSGLEKRKKERAGMQNEVCILALV
jgi:hypothetical protein